MAQHVTSDTNSGNSPEPSSDTSHRQLHYVVPVVWEGVLTATASIHQGGEKLGFNSYLRRERYATQTPTGNREGFLFVDVPVISGNSVRGVLRGLAADLWWVGAGEPQLSTAVAHAIWSGGSLAKNSTTTLTGRNLMEVIEVCPVVELFGTAGGGRIVDGKLSVSKVIPLCSEVKDFVPEKYRHLCSNTFWDFLQMEHYSRSGAKNITQTSTASGESSDRALTEGDMVEGDMVEGDGVMRYGVESFIPGTKFYIKISAQWLSAASYSFLTATVNSFTQRGHLGGRSGTGLGMFTADFDREPPKVDETFWSTHLSQVPESTIMERLGRLS